MESAQSLEPYIAVDDGVGKRGEELEEEMAHGASGESGSVSKAPTSQEEPGPGPGPAILNELLPSAARSPSSISPLVSTNSHPESIPSPAPPPRDAIATTEAPAPSQNSDTEHLRPDPVPQQHSQDTMADNQVKEGDQGMTPFPLRSRTSPSAPRCIGDENGLTAPSPVSLSRHASVGQASSTA